MGFKEDALADVESGKKAARIERCDSCKAFISLAQKDQQNLNELLGMDRSVVPMASIARILSKYSGIQINPGPFSMHVKKHKDPHVIQG